MAANVFWTCSECTWENLDFIKICEGCETARDAGPVAIARVTSQISSTSCQVTGNRSFEAIAKDIDDIEMSELRRRLEELSSLTINEQVVRLHAFQEEIDGSGLTNASREHMYALIKAAELKLITDEEQEVISLGESFDENDDHEHEEIVDDESIAKLHARKAKETEDIHDTENLEANRLDEDSGQQEQAHTGYAQEQHRRSEKKQAAESWAIHRQETLVHELRKIRLLPVCSRRAALRALQLELHPDKQELEFREHSQHLFLQVQREWEMVEASRQARNTSEDDLEELIRREACRTREEHERRRQREEQRQEAERNKKTSRRQDAEHQRREQAPPSWATEDPEESSEDSSGSAAEMESGDPLAVVELHVQGLKATTEKIVVMAQRGWTGGEVKIAFEKITKKPGAGIFWRLLMGSTELFDHRPLLDLPRGSKLDLIIHERPPKYNDRCWVSQASQQRSVTLEHASTNLRNDKDLIMAAVKKDWRAFRYASPELQGDRDIFLAAVERNGLLLETARKSFRRDHGIVFAAVQQNWRALPYASRKFRSSKLLLATAMQQDPTALQHASPKLLGDKHILLDAVSKNGSLLLYASPALRSDRELVLTALRSNAGSFAHAAIELQVCQDFIMEAVSTNTGVLRFVPERFREVAEEAVFYSFSGSLRWQKSFKKRSPC